MGKVKFNPAVDALSGKLGNIIYRQLWGSNIFGRAPDPSERVPTAAQAAENEKFKKAGAIWKVLPAQIKAAYRDWGKRVNKPPYALFNKNCSHPPAVDGLDLSLYHGAPGQSITVRATDLFAVAAVEVRIQQASGDLVEAGPAVQSATEPELWIYQSTATVPRPANLVIEAVAVNWPGKKDNRKEVLVLSEAPGAAG